MSSKRTVKVESTVVKVEKKPMCTDTKRYIHENPYAFKGRLGYACLNTILRAQKPPVFCSRTCRLDTVTKKGIDYVKELALANIADLKTLVQWNEDHKIKFMRISSDMFPLASHEKAGYEVDFAEKELKEIGDLAKKYNQRLTTHPGQFNQLVSLNPKVVTNTIRELHYHARMLDLMGLDQDAVMIIHMGGVYGDKQSALERFEKEYVKLPEHIKRRLVLENDEMGYSVSDLLPICKKLGVPLVLDWHHHYINPGEVTDLVALLPEINKIWYDKGIKPKQHYSESRKGAVTPMELRAHSDRVKYLPPTTDDVDLMIEAKDKEQAVFQLYKTYNLETVDDDVWVPQEGTESMRTNGRKSSKKKAKKEEEDGVAVKRKTTVKEEDEETQNDTATKKKRKSKKTEEAVEVKVEMNDVPVVEKKKRNNKKPAKIMEVKAENEDLVPTVAVIEESTAVGRVTRSKKSANKEA